MRAAVKKPKNLNKENYKSPIQKPRTGEPTPARISRAMNMMKHSRVERFGAPLSQTKSALSRLSPSAKPDKAALPAKTTTAAKAVGQPVPSMVTSVSHQRLERMLDEALVRADAHKKGLKNRSRGKGRLGRLRVVPRWMAVSFAVLAVLSATIFIAWHNVPYASMKFASLRSQVKGSLPAYAPSGFRFSGPIQYQSGAISMTYKAQDDRYYTVEQEASAWDSSSLDENSVPDDSQVQTSQVKGTTVYYHSADGRATWVSEGKRYVIHDHAQLNPDEIFKIAGSIL
jgi:hypothetical protein